MPKVSQYNSTAQFFEMHSPKIYEVLVYNINIKKLLYKLKSSLLFKKNKNFTGKKLGNSQNNECEIFNVLFLCEPEYLVKI